MNNLPEGFLENRLQELLADDDLDGLRSGFAPPPPRPQPSVNFDQSSAVRRPVSFDQPSAVRRPPTPADSMGPALGQNPAMNNFDQPSGRRVPGNAPNFNQPTRPPQRPAQGNLDQMRQAAPPRANFDQPSRAAQGRRATFDSPSRVKHAAPPPPRAPQGQSAAKGGDWSSSLLNSISSYDEKTQPDTAELLQGALEALTDAVIITDSYGRLTWVNRYASELLDMPSTSLIGTPATAVFGQYAAAFVPAELLLLAPSGRLNDWQITLLLPSAVRRSMVFNFALTRRNGEQVVVAIGHEYREAPVAAPTVPQAIPIPSPAANVAERITVRLRPDGAPPLPLTAFSPVTTAPVTPTVEPPPPLPPPMAVPPSEIPAPPAAPVYLAPPTNPAPSATMSVSESMPEIVRAGSEPVYATPAPVMESQMIAHNVVMPESGSYVQEPAPIPVKLPVEAIPAYAPEPAPASVVPPVIPVTEMSFEVAPVAPMVSAAPELEVAPLIEAVLPQPVTEPVVIAPAVPAHESVMALPTEPAPMVIAPAFAPVEVAENVVAPLASAQVQESAPEESVAAQFWQFLEYAPEPMMVTDQRGRIVQLNGLAEQLFGYDRSEMLGEKALALLAKRSRNGEYPRFPFGVADQAFNGVSEVVEVYGWHRDGTEFPIELTRRQTDNGQHVVSSLRPLVANPSLASLELPLEPSIPPTPSLPPDYFPSDSENPNAALSSSLVTFNERLRRHNRALGELSRSTVWRQNGLTASLQEITAVTAQALDTARVSIWLFNDARTELICQDLFEAVDERHSQGMRLTAAEFPHYFAALAADRSIAAHDAHTDKRTAEFSECYLKPNNISSMLDAPIRALGRHIGVVCHEHIGAPREWSPEEETFAASVADFVAMAYEAEERQFAQNAQARLAAVLQATPDCVSITGPDGRLIFLNESGRRLVERTQGEDIGDLLVSDLYSPAAYAQMENVILPAALQNGVWTGESTLRRADGSEMPVAQVTFVQKQAQGRVEFIAHIHHDITLRKQMEEERLAVLEHEQQLRRSAEENIQHKDDFLSTLSHELRTPLTGIVGWIDLIRSGTLNEEELERALATIERDAQTQMKLVDDLLDASRAISDKLTIDERPLELMNVVAAALDTVRPQIEEKDIKLNISFQPWVGPFVGDASRLQQVVWNLLSNAVKFTPAGGTIEVALARNQTQALILVRDNGIGITPEFLPHLFERFRQQDGSTQRRFGGLGLGLAIAKHIVELHQGNIVAHSAGVNQGTEFVVTLPLAAAQPAPAAAPKVTGLADRLNKNQQSRPPLLAGVRVLAIDDQPGARDLFRTILMQYQAEVHLAASALEARQLLTTWRPHVIVSDIGMPDEDGCEMMRHIRALVPEHGGNIPAIALTAYVSEQDRTRALQAGFNAHLAKPVNPEELVNLIAQLMNPLRQAVERLSNSGSLNDSSRVLPPQ
jgi:PAS domain S-box-containing protein